MPQRFLSNADLIADRPMLGMVRAEGRLGVPALADCLKAAVQKSKKSLDERIANTQPQRICCDSLNQHHPACCVGLDLSCDNQRRQDQGHQ